MIKYIFQYYFKHLPGSVARGTTWQMLWNHWTFEHYYIYLIRSVIHIHTGLLVIVLQPKRSGAELPQGQGIRAGWGHWYLKRQVLSHTHSGLQQGHALFIMHLLILLLQKTGDLLLTKHIRRLLIDNVFSFLNKLFFCFWKAYFLPSNLVTSKPGSI